MERFTGITYVIPCGGSKLDRPAPARELYTGSMFRHTLTVASRAAADDMASGRGPARVLILSALHGLVELDTVLAPYDLKMGRPGSVDVATLMRQAEEFGMGWGPGDDDGPGEVYAMLPRAYYAALSEALQQLYVYPQDVYEACSGLFDQKVVNAHVGRIDVPAAVDNGPGPKVYLGTTVTGLWWGTRVLVNYGRMAAAKQLPRATAPWALDSRAFTELEQHGTWTISAEAYAADIVRYADQVGQLEWAAPQDWPCRPSILAKTGLTEVEQQRRTIASVTLLRRLVAGRVEILDVLTGLDVEGYLRHLAMYAAAGVDLTQGDRLVGVGALVGRRPEEVATIIRALYAAGVTRIHAFGVKGPALDLIGLLLESTDSSDWSRAARRHTGRCPHGLVEWEQNCPVAAQQWGSKSRARAAAGSVQLAIPMSV